MTTATEKTTKKDEREIAEALKAEEAAKKSAEAIAARPVPTPGRIVEVEYFGEKWPAIVAKVMGQDEKVGATLLVTAFGVGGEAAKLLHVEPDMWAWPSPGSSASKVTP